MLWSVPQLKPCGLVTPSAMVTGAPPSSEIFFCFPPAKKATDLPSGEKTGLTAPSVPAMATGDEAFNSRRKSREPSALLALMAMRKPSGEIATFRSFELSEVPTGGAITFRGVPREHVEQFAAADPYVEAGLVTSQRIELWNAT